jgi:4-aminobutyrate aminotransferase-like enzyme
MTVRVLSTSLASGTAEVPIVQGGDGAHLIMTDGRRVLDASNTAAPLGHCHPEMMESLREAAHAPVVNEGWRWRDRERAAEDLVAEVFSGADWVGAVRWFISASEANDAALSLAQALTGRAALATRERAYHGGVGLARELTVQPQWQGALASTAGDFSSPPRLADVRQLPAPISARVTGQPDPTAGQAWHEQAERDLADAAAVLLDYSQGGVYHTPAYQDTVAAMARKNGCLWIADETVTGLGRVGLWTQFSAGTSRPDMVTMGKCLAAGAAPAGALVLSKDVLAAIGDRAWQSYSSFRGHPAAMAAIRTHVRVSAREDLAGRAAAADRIFEAGLQKISEAHPSVVRIDGRGMHWTVELRGADWREWRGQEASPIASRVTAAALDRNVLVATSGEQTSLFLAPPLVATDRDLERLLDVLDESLLVADRAESD